MQNPIPFSDWVYAEQKSCERLHRTIQELNIPTIDSANLKASLKAYVPQFSRNDYNIDILFFFAVYILNLLISYFSYPSFINIFIQILDRKYVSIVDK